MIDAVNESIDAYLSIGAIDPKRQSAPIEALRKLAAIVDSGVNEKDNVTFPTMLKYMAALGMMPQEIKITKQTVSKTEKMKTKFSKFSSGENAEG